MFKSAMVNEPSMFESLKFCCVSFQKMSLRRIASNLTPTGTKEDIPVVFHEPHVETGFRLTHQPWYYYLFSLFQRHNECMNSWTHLVAMFIVIGRLYKITHEYDFIGDPWMWPMCAGSITMVVMYFCSFSAHCFHNMSEQLHYTCFFIDYAGIGLFGLGSTIIHYVYCSDKRLIGSAFDRCAVPVGVFIAVLVCFLCSYAKTKYKRPYPFARRAYQLVGVLSIYTWLIIPIVQRLYLGMEYPALWDQSLDDHTTQMYWFLLSGFFFATDIPQRFYPGKFDFLFHSHQIFHVCILIMNLKQIDGIYLDLKLRKDVIFSRADVPTFYNTFGAVILCILLDLVVIWVFHNKAKQRIASEHQVKFEN